MGAGWYDLSLVRPLRLGDIVWLALGDTNSDLVTLVKG